MIIDIVGVCGTISEAVCVGSPLIIIIYKKVVYQWPPPPMPRTCTQKAKGVSQSLAIFISIVTRREMNSVLVL